jgi:methionyl-tRNA synthetase
MDKDLLAQVEKGFDTVAAELEAVHLRAALAEAMRLATEVNKYLDQTAPWTTIKTDKSAAARSVFTALKAIDSLKILLAPFLPFTSERLNGFFGNSSPIFGKQYIDTITDDLGTHTALRYDPDGAAGRWEPSTLKPGQELVNPQPLFKKLDASIIEEERKRLGRV